MADKKIKPTKALQKLLEKAEELGWTVGEPYQEESTKRCFIPLENYSPAGEDLCEEIEFRKRDQVASFTNSLFDLYMEFDVDDHVEMWIEARRNGVAGVPSSIKALVEDAEAIEKMYENLCNELNAAMNEEV